MEEVYIPELGLSNKGKDMMSSQERKEQEDMLYKEYKDKRC